MKIGIILNVLKETYDSTIGSRRPSRNSKGLNYGESDRDKIMRLEEKIDILQETLDRQNDFLEQAIHKLAVNNNAEIPRDED